MRKKLGLFGVLMVTVFLAASLIVPATASAWSTADTLADIATDPIALKVLRYTIYEELGYGMTLGGTGTLGGDTLTQDMGPYEIFPIDLVANGFPDFGIPAHAPQLLPILGDINTNLADQQNVYEANCPTCFHFRFSTIPELYGAYEYQGEGYDTPKQWDVMLDILIANDLDTSGFEENVGALKYFTLYDLGTGYNSSILPADLALDAAWADLCDPVPGSLLLLSNGLIGPALDAAWGDICVPVPGSLLLLSSGLIGLVGTRRRFRK